jgi:hypothetical protein
MHVAMGPEGPGHIWRVASVEKDPNFKTTAQDLKNQMNTQPLIDGVSVKISRAAQYLSKSETAAQLESPTLVSGFTGSATSPSIHAYTLSKAVGSPLAGAKMDAHFHAQ